MSTDGAPRILLVHDEPAVRTLITRALRQESYQVVSVTDGQAGLNAAKSADGPYDLVITNSYLPHLTGEQVIEQLRQLFPGLPILHLDDLSHPAPSSAEDAPTPYKPFSLDDLLAAVRRLIAASPSSLKDQM
jgi:two-component system OmpR family response regulator